MTGLPAAAPWSSRPRGSERPSPAKARRCRRLGGPPGSCLHDRPTRTALAEKNLQARPRAGGLRLPPLLARSGSRPLPGGARTRRAPRGTGWSGLPSPLLTPLFLPHPPRGAGSPQSLDAARHRARSRLCPRRRHRPRARMGGDGRTGRRGVGAGRPGVRWSPEFPRGRTEGTQRLGLCTRSTDRASCSRAAADHAWPRQPIGRSLTHLCR